MSHRNPARERNDDYRDDHRADGVRQATPLEPVDDGIEADREDDRNENHEDDRKELDERPSDRQRGEHFCQTDASFARVDYA